MSSRETYDVAVIGGGIVGLATAMTLLGRERRSLVLLEAESRLATHQTGHNSGVIHSGIYYKPGSLKARLCTEGRDAMYRLCAERGLPVQRCGKVIVAADESELPNLAELERRGRENGLQSVRRCSPDELRELEPHAAGVAALHVGETGIVDFAQVARTIGTIVQERGGDVRTGTPVLAIAANSAGFTLVTPAGEIRCRNLVNCAGLHSDRIALMCGAEPGVRIVPFRGEYRTLRPERRHLIRGLIYPVPDPALPFLGVHFTRTIAGEVEAGPNAVLALARHGYRRTSVSLRHVSEMLAYEGFRRMARTHWKTGMSELRRSLSPALFLRSLQRLVPSVRAEDLALGETGVRAQAVTPDGRLADDFLLVEGPGVVHVLNAPSPAATASLAIARVLCDRISSVIRPG